MITSGLASLWFSTCGVGVAKYLTTILVGSTLKISATYQSVESGESLIIIISPSLRGGIIPIVQDWVRHWDIAGVDDVLGARHFVRGDYHIDVSEERCGFATIVFI